MTDKPKFTRGPHKAQGAEVFSAGTEHSHPLLLADCRNSPVDDEEALANATLFAAAADMLAALKAIEWSGRNVADMDTCPDCMTPRYRKHTRDCALASAIAKAEKRP